MASKQTFAVVGASLAGAKAAETLRTEGFDGRVLLIGEEPVRPYERPPLSKEYLRGEKGFDDAAVHAEDFYGQHDIELRLSTSVTNLDAGSSKITLGDGEEIAFDRLLLATGAVPRRLTIPGADLDGVRYLRTVANSDALRQLLGGSTRLVVIGAGWIGAEVAASARQLGTQVDLVAPTSAPLERVLGREVGEIYRKLHADHGVGLHLGLGADEVIGSERVEAVRLSDGTTIPADVVLVGIGVRPRTDLAETAGLALDNGVVVNEHLETSVPGIFAAGDIANAFHPRYQTYIRLEHWAAALNQGPAAAQAMLGRDVVYDQFPYFFSDQFELSMEYRGRAPDYEQVVFRGDPTSGEFIAFWIHEGKIAAAMNANIWDQGDELEALLAADEPVDLKRLADPEVALGELATPASS